MNITDLLNTSTNLSNTAKKYTSKKNDLEKHANMFMSRLDTDLDEYGGFDTIRKLEEESRNPISLHDRATRIAKDIYDKDSVNAENIRDIEEDLSKKFISKGIPPTIAEALYRRRNINNNWTDSSLNDLATKYNDGGKYLVNMAVQRYRTFKNVLGNALSSAEGLEKTYGELARDYRTVRDENTRDYNQSLITNALNNRKKTAEAYYRPAIDQYNDFISQDPYFSDLLGTSSNNQKSTGSSWDNIKQNKNSTNPRIVAVQAVNNLLKSANNTNNNANVDNNIPSKLSSDKPVTESREQELMNKMNFQDYLRENNLSTLTNMPSIPKSEFQINHPGIFDTPISRAIYSWLNSVTPSNNNRQEAMKRLGDRSRYPVNKSEIDPNIEALEEALLND